MRLLCEQLEVRAVPAGAIRVVTYNMEADINGVTTPRSGFYQVLEGIGEEVVQGRDQPLDILTLEETTSNSTTVAPIVNNLNSYYNGAAVYAQSTYQATQSGSNNGGNGPNALVYNTTTLQLLASVGVGTPQGATNGEYRQVVRYEFQPVGQTGSSGVFYVYVSHMKSGTTSADITARGQEATIIRNDEATLPASASVLYTGDLNSSPPEAEFTNFTAAGQGQAFDPLNFSTSVQYYSESSTDLRYRDDYELMTSNVQGDTGAINYVSGTLHAFGNNGTTPSGGSVNSGSDTALNSDLVQDDGAFISAATLYADLTTASDHLPVFADYTLPATSTTTTILSSYNPAPYGQSVTFTAKISPQVPSNETVTFKDGTTTLGTGTTSPGPTGYAVAAFTTSQLSTGSHGITATYAGDSSYTSSTSGALSQVVNQVATSTTLSSLTNPSTFGQTVTFLAVASGGPTPTGTVTFYDGSTLLGTGTLNVNGGTSFATSTLSAGTHGITAVYGGDTNHGGSTSAVVSQVVKAVTTTSLTDNGPNPSLNGTAVSFTVSVTGGPAVSGEAVTIEDASNNNQVVATSPTSVTLSGGSATFTASGLAAGMHNLFAVYAGDATHAASSSSQVTQSVQTTFQVVSSTATTNGVVLLFNAPVDPATTWLYNSPSGTLGAADVTVVGASTGSVRGSLVIDPTNPYTATFVKTGSPLATDTYTVTVTTAVQAVGGATLAANYSNSLSVTAPTTPVVSVPSFARGAGQAVNVPNSGSGLPVSITGAAGVTQVSFTLSYDPTLLTIAAAGAVTPSTAAGAVGLTDVSYGITGINANHNNLTVTISGGSGLSAGATPVPLVSIAATVPNSAPYTNKSVLSLSAVQVNATAAAGQWGIDEAGYFGDVSGDKQISALDGSLLAQDAVGLGSGFSAYKDLDPTIIGDVTGASALSGLDASLIVQDAAGLSVAQIPAVPGGISVTSGADPVLFFQNLQAAPGQTVTAQLDMDVTDARGIQFAAADYAIRFNPAVFTVSNVRAGTLAAGYQTVAGTVDNTHGILRVAQATGNPQFLAGGTTGSVLFFDVTVSARAVPGTRAALNLAASASSNGSTTHTDVAADSGALVLGQAPTNGAHDAGVDGTLTVTGPPGKTKATPLPRAALDAALALGLPLAQPAAAAAHQDLGLEWLEAVTEQDRKWLEILASSKSSFDYGNTGYIIAD